MRQGPDTSQYSGDESFVSVARSDAASSAPASDGSSFYLAINKKELGQKYFLSAYLTQYFPGAVAYGAAHSLGTRVVSFRVQNGKLFVFDASDLHKDSNTFDPSLIVDAYPIVTGVLSAKDAQSFIAFDPAAGMNRFGVVGDAFASGQPAAHFQVELSYLQRYRTIADGITFEQVFTGFSDASDPNSWLGGENNSFRGSGTLGIALRKYSVGAGYQLQQVPQQGEMFFRSDLALVPNTGAIAAPAIHWNIHSGMKPIKWLISEKVNNLKTDPQLGQYDVMGALKNAILAWNGVFGFQVLDVATATGKDSYGDDDTNYVLWDEDPTFGAAFANWRNNPNNGEIRGASVYMNVSWVQIADQIFADGPVAHGSTQPQKQQRPKVPGLVWEAMRNEPLCMLWAPQYRPDEGALHEMGISSAMTKKEKVEAFLTHVLVHEIGHTLGLRHNFKGSIVPPSTSVMDYLSDADSIACTKPQAYDTDAIKYLYGLSQSVPAQPFCTDEDTSADPDCNTFDNGADPLADTYAPRYQGYLQQFLTGAAPTPPNSTLNGVLKFVRAGTDDEAKRAWSIAIDPLRVGVKLADRSQAAAVDVAANRVLTRLLLDGPEKRGMFFWDPSLDGPVGADILAEINANLLDTDGIRSFTTRRNMVDILKKAQTLGAFQMLRAARDAIQARREKMTGDEAALTDDLLARIDLSTNPYFN